MAAIDDLSELVENAAAAEKVAVSSKWKERPDVAKMVARLRKSADDQRSTLREHVDPLALSSRWVSIRQHYLDLGPQDLLPEPGTAADQLSDDPAVAAEHQLSHAGAAQAERDAAVAVTFARLALNDAALAVLQARIARIDAGEDDPDAATVDGHVPLHGRNPVSRHGPALAHGLLGEIKYVLARKPRNTMKSLAVALAMGLLYLGFIRLFEWDTDQKWLPYLGLWAIGVVMGGSVCVNAMSFDAMRVRAALDDGARLWHLLPIKQRRQSGSLKQFIIAFVVAYFIGYLVNAMLVWRVFAAQELTERLGNALLPAFIIIISSVFMWILLTIVAVALAQQPKIRRVMQKEITDYKANAEMKAFAEEAAQEAAAGKGQTAAAGAPA
jgi:hypothetical protein